ncbi:MAG: roadblock/LC7 family protein [Chloroflexi bacterium]|jgi:predicted regulator of Ras-like GTPase activity (Roadblock/LC7/MglB family)|nr:roadblock/LC7 family protein [Chloroflexota bacterium]
MPALKDVLSKFKAVNSVDLAVLVNSDGMQIESFNRGNLDVDEVSGIASTGLQVSEALGGATARGETRQAVLEYAGGSIILEPLNEETFLVVVSTDPRSIGKIRFLSKRYRQDLISALNGN